jgi:hypothetical protein
MTCFNAFCFALLLPTVAVSAEPPAPAAPDITGCWSGYWISCKNGHNGPLTARICKINDTCYEAEFRGRFWQVIPFRYTTAMQVTGQEGDKLFLSTSRRLPLMGTFEMTATATSTDLVAEFTSRNDQGQFILKR